MSYPSIKKIIEQKKFDLEEENEEELTSALWEAFEHDLPQGISYLQKMAENVKKNKQRLLQIEDPKSKLGQEIIRLVGTDIARDIVEQKLGIALGLYNCCAPVAALKKEDLHMSSLEQIQLQNGTKGYADC